MDENAIQKLDELINIFVKYVQKHLREGLGYDPIPRKDGEGNKIDYRKDEEKVYYLKDEGYKFEFVPHFKKNFLKGLNEKNISERIKGSFWPKHVSMGGDMAKTAPMFSLNFEKPNLNEAVKQNSKDCLKSIKNLINKKKKFAERIDQFIQVVDSYKKKEWKNSVRLGIPAYILACTEPNKYSPFAARVYYAIYKYATGQNPPKKKKNGEKLSYGEKYSLYLDFIEEVVERLKENKEYTKIHEELVKKCEFKDKNYKWGAYDFFYNAVRREEIWNSRKLPKPNPEEVNFYNAVRREEIWNPRPKQEPFAKNIILFGPPGTGKTFKTKELAVKIMGNIPAKSIEESDPVATKASLKAEEIKEKIEGAGLKLTSEPIIKGNQMQFRFWDGNESKMAKDSYFIYYIKLHSPEGDYHGF